MRLNFGSIEFDAKGLPRIYSLRVSPGILGEGPVTVSILLDSNERAAVAKWAKRLGVQVVDCKPYRARPEYPWTQTFEAVHEAEGYRVRVWTSHELDDALPWHVYAQPQDAAQWLVNAFATRKLAERFTERHPDEYGPLSIECACEHEFPPPTGNPDADDYAPADCTRCGMTYAEYDAGTGERIAAALERGAEQETTHHAVMRHGSGGPECGTGRVWEPMTRAWKDVTCPACLAALDVESGGAS